MEIVQRNRRIVLKRRQIGKIGNMGEIDGCNPDFTLFRAACRIDLGRERYGIFGINGKAPEIWDNPEHRNSGHRFKHLYAITEQIDIPSKAVDDNPFNQCAIFGRKNGKRSNHLTENSPTVNICDKNNGCARESGCSEIDKIAVVKVHLGTGTSPFDNHQFMALHKPFKTFAGSLGPESGIPEIALRRLRRTDFPLQHHLRSGIGVRFQKHRIHVSRWHNPGGLGLDNLRPTDFTAVWSDTGVVRHVLRLVGGDIDACVVENPAERRGDNAFADVRSGAKDGKSP